MLPLSLAILLLFAPFTRSALQPAATNWNSSARSTTTPPSSLVTQPPFSCPCDFRRSDLGVALLAWSALNISTTITAATVVYIVNSRMNTTRTSTIFNELPEGFTLPRTNSDGTAVGIVATEWPPGTTSTTSVAFPTGYVGYDYGVLFEGHMRVTSGSQVLCVSAPEGGSSTLFPSFLSPQFPTATWPATLPYETEALEDTKGLVWTLTHGYRELTSRYNVNYTSLYPDFPPFLPQCHGNSSRVSPMTYAVPAKFLTDTTTLHEDTEPTSSAQATSNSIQRSAIASALSTPTATSTPRIDRTADAAGGVASSLNAAASATQQQSVGDTAPAVASSIPESISDSSRNAPLADTSDVRTPSATPAATPAATPLTPVSPSSSAAQANVPPSSAFVVQAPPAAPAISASSSALPVNTVSAPQVFGVSSATPPAPNSPSDSPAPANVPATSDSIKQAPSAAAPISVGNSAVPISAVTVPQAVGASPSSSIAFVIDGQTAAVGQTVTVQSTPIAIHTSNGRTAVAIGGTETMLPAAHVPGEASAAATAAAVVPSPISLNGQTISVNSESAYVVGAQTLAPGRPITVGSGSSTTIVALTTDSAGQSVVVVGSSSSVIPAATGENVATAAGVPPSLVIGGQTISANSASAYIVGSQTLAPGTPVTLGSGSATTVVALTTNSAGESVIVVGTTTSVLPTANGASAAAAATASASAVAVAGHTISANSASAYVIEGQTLIPGAPVTLGSGSAVVTALLTSNSAGQSIVVVGSSTALLPTLANAGPTTDSVASSTQGSGVYTRLGGSQTAGGTSAGGGTPSGTGSSTSTVFTADSSGVGRRGGLLLYGAVLVVGFLLVVLL